MSHLVTRYKDLREERVLYGSNKRVGLKKHGMQRDRCEANIGQRYASYESKRLPSFYA